jgi:L-fuculose-phosphate aldolase
MDERELHALRDEIVRGAQGLADAGILSASKHGNWSVRIPGTDRILMTGSSLTNVTPEQLAVLTLDGELVDGSMTSTSAEIIRMHTCIYIERPGVGSVVHTHSPYTTAFAVASRPLECFSEALARLGSAEPIPVAKYGPRGSDQAVANIVEALKESPHQPAVLLENHGLLAFGPDVAAAGRMVFALEETAQLAILASAIGTPRALSPQLAAQAQQRRQEFEQAGVRTAHG